MRTPSAVLAFIVGPIRTEIDPQSGAVVLTHLQKFSRCGFLLTWPFCFHIWLFWKKQMNVGPESWIPGTEQGIYMRTPGWRYDQELGMKFTGGYVGLHWD